MFFKYFRRPLAGLIGCFLCGFSSAQARSASMPISPVRIEKIVSAKLGETREYWVSLPDGYAESPEKYPVLYMLDGEFNFNSGVIGGLRRAAGLGETPEFIIVGVVNTDRSKDVFPEVVTYGDGSRDGGRADAFLDFIGSELIPRIEKDYRTGGFRALYGTSNTGFTAVYAFFRNPGLARAVIAASATLSVPIFRNHRDQWIREYSGGSRGLILVMGENDLPTILSLNGALKEAVDMRAPAGLTCRLSVLEHGEHVPFDSLLEGLRRYFEGWTITTPLKEDTFPEVRAQADERLAKYGVEGKIPEEALIGLGNRLLGEKKNDRAAEVLEYTIGRYPRSVGAWIGRGDAYRSAGRADKARECYVKALQWDPQHREAAARLKDLDK